MVVTQSKKLDDFLQWCVNQSFCLESAVIKNGSVALAAGDSILGRLLVKVSGVWNLVDATTGAAISPTSDVAVCLRAQKITTAFAGAATITDTPNGGECLVLARGPALLQKEDFIALLDGAVDQADLLLALAAKDIRYVVETGLVYSPNL